MDKNITKDIYIFLQDKINSGEATRCEQKVFDILDLDVGSIIVNTEHNVWFFNQNNAYDRIPKYFFQFLEKYIFKKWSVIPFKTKGV